MFSAADVPSAPKPTDQVPKQASAAHDNAKQLVTLQDLRDFQSGQRKFQDTTTAGASSDQNSYQSAIRNTLKNDSHSIDSILGNFALTNNASDRSPDHKKPALADTASSLPNQEIAKLLKNVNVQPVSESLSDLLKELNADNTKNAGSKQQNDSRTHDALQQHRPAYSTQPHEAAPHHRDAYSTLESKAAEHHRNPQSIRETPYAQQQHRNAYSTLESEAAEHHRDPQSIRETPHAHHHRDAHDLHEKHVPREVRHTRTHDEAPINADHFAEVAKRVIARVGHNGQVTHEELAKAVQDKSFKGQDAQVLAALYHSFKQLNNKSGHDSQSGTITAADLDKYQQIKSQTDKQAVDLRMVGDWATNNLTTFSSDGKSLSQNDVQRALHNPNTSAHDKQMLNEIEHHWSEMTSPKHANVNPQDVQTLFDNFAKSDNAKLVNDVTWACQLTAMHGQKAELCNDLYAGDAISSISHGDVKQGLCGDCYFESVVGALARTNPQAIKNMIHDNGNGTYDVKFPGMAPGERPITVAAPTETELGLYNGGSKYGCWASVLEKAYGQYSENHQTSHPVETPEEGADGGGTPAQVLKLLTNKDATVIDPSATSEAKMAQALQNAVDHKLAVAASIYSCKNGAENTPDGLPTDHSYTITGIRNVGGHYMVDIRNPWGYDQNGVAGTFSLPLSQFMKDFNAVSIEGR